MKTFTAPKPNITIINGKEILIWVSNTPFSVEEHTQEGLNEVLAVECIAYNVTDDKIIASEYIKLSDLIECEENINGRCDLLKKTYTKLINQI